MKSYSYALLFLHLFFLLSCVKKQAHSTLTQSGRPSVYENLVVLRPKINTYFKKSTAIVTKSPWLPRCGLTKDIEVALQISAPPKSVDKKLAQKYYYGRLVNRGGRNFEERGGFCLTEDRGFIYKDHVEFVRKAVPTDIPQGLVILPTSEQDLMSAQESLASRQAPQDDSATPPPGVELQPTSAPVPDVPAIAEPIPALPPSGAVASGEYQGLGRTTHPIVIDPTDYVKDRTVAAVERLESEAKRREELKARGEAYRERYFMIAAFKSGTPRTNAFYSKDGRTRIFGLNRPAVLYTVNMAPLRFRDWEGKVRRRILVALQQDSLLSDSCEEYRGPQDQPARFTKGQGFTPCVVPVDEHGIPWVWIDCDSFVFNWYDYSKGTQMHTSRCMDIAMTSQEFAVQP